MKIFCATDPKSFFSQEAEIISADKENKRILIIVGTLICSVLVFLICLVTLSILKKRGNCKGLFKVLCCCCGSEAGANDNDNAFNLENQRQNEAENLPPIV